MKATMFTMTLDFKEKRNYMFFDGFVEALIEEGFVGRAYLEEVHSILTKRLEEVCICEHPFQPIGGLYCELCQKRVKAEAANV